MLSDADVTIMIGKTLGPYQVVAKLGEGGMGEVYRATDTRLKRDVAIKVLPAAFTEDRERLARFEREAQLLAQLQHPNIASIFGIEESGGVRALVMELVDGPTLADRLEQGRLPVDESLSIARQLAEALEEAHERGIVHRDLKPQNIKAAAEGKVKVLDFGLAKAMDPTAGSATDLARSPTMMHSPTLTAAHGTQLGVILGTAAYMAPEQARGGAIDKRADIWAFGVVLYEMLSGRQLFAGETVSDTLAGVLKTEIDWNALPTETPLAIRRLLRRCLERNPRNRLHDIADARIVIDDVASGRVEEGATESSGKAARRAVWPFVAAAAAAGLALGVLLAGMLAAPGGGAESAVPHVELEIAPPAAHQFVSGLALSADGRRLALVARGEDGRTALWVRSLDAPEARMIPGTTDARYPFWSPDGRQLGFFAQNRLKVTDLMGGGARTLAETGATTDTRGGTWGADERIVYAPTFIGSMVVIDAGGGQPEPATRIPEGSDLGTQRFPSFLPDGRRFVYYASTGTGVEPGTLYLGRLGSLDAKRLGPAASAAHYAPPGVLLYVQGDSLVAHRFDDQREELVGHAEPLGIALPGSVGVSGQRSLAVSNQGTLVYRADKRSATRLVWVNRRGEEIGTVASEPDIWHYGPRLSPDGRRLAVSRYEPGSTSGAIWIHDLTRGMAYPLTFGDRSDDTVVIWSLDGTELAYAAVGGERASGIYRIDARQAGSERLWIPGDRFRIPAAWLPGGGLLYQENDESGGFSLWTTDLEGRAPRRLGPERIGETSPALSPDGRWVAFGSDATRRVEVYVRRLDDSTREGALRVSSDGGNFPRWRGDGRELYYVDDNGRVMAVPLELGAKATVGTPQALFQARLEESADSQYDVTADGERFLLNRTTIEDRVPVSVVLGWPARLGRSSAR
jgi:Tol biopolymer transport system component